MSITVNKMYVSKKEAPLKWFYFTKFIRIPICVITLGIDLYKSLLMIFNSLEIMLLAGISKVCVLLFLEFAIIVLGVLFFIGSFNWKKYAWYSYLIYIPVQLLMIILAVFISTPEMSASSWGTIFGWIVPSYLEYIYFMKRKNLFNNSREDTIIAEVKNISSTNKPSINNDVEQNINTLENEANSSTKVCENLVSDNINFCRMCGTPISEDALFCKKCGAKIN